MAKKKTKKTSKTKLTPKQQTFVDEYLIDLNATQAATRAGYSKKTAKSQGQRLLTNVDIAYEIDKHRLERSERTEITQDMVLREYWRLASSDLREVMTWGGERAVAHESSMLTDDAALAVSEVSMTKDGIKIKLHDKKGALDSVAKHLGMFEQNQQKPDQDKEPKEVLMIEDQ